MNEFGETHNPEGESEQPEPIEQVPEEESDQSKPVEPVPEEETKKPERKEEDEGVLALREGALRVEVHGKYGQPGIDAINILARHYEPDNEAFMYYPHDMINDVSSLDDSTLSEIAELTRQHGLDAFNLEKVIEWRGMKASGHFDNKSAPMRIAEVEDLFKRPEEESDQSKPVEPVPEEETKKPERKEGGEGALRVEVHGKYGQPGIDAINMLDMHHDPDIDVFADYPSNVITHLRDLDDNTLSEIAKLTRQYGLDAFNLEKVIEYRGVRARGEINKHLLKGGEQIRNIFKR